MPKPLCGILLIAQNHAKWRSTYRVIRATEFLGVLQQCTIASP